MKLTHEQLIGHLLYDKETGEFSLKNDASGRLHGRYFAGKRMGWQMLNGYVGVSLFGKQFYAHRLAWMYVNGSFPDGVIDHINGNRSDNRFENLRSVTQKINAQNLKKSHSDSGTGVLGVTYCKAENKFIAQITSGRKRVTKRFKDKEIAGNFYIEMKRRMHDGSLFEVK